MTKSIDGSVEIDYFWNLHLLVVVAVCCSGNFIGYDYLICRSRDANLCNKGPVLVLNVNLKYRCNS